MERLLFPFCHWHFLLDPFDDVPWPQRDILIDDVHRQLISGSLSVLTLVIKQTQVVPSDTKVCRRRVEELEVAALSRANKHL